MPLAHVCIFPLPQVSLSCLKVLSSSLMTLFIVCMGVSAVVCENPQYVWGLGEDLSDFNLLSYL